MENNNSAAGGSSLGTVLTLVFVILKLTGVIDWSWWWVLSPIWIPFSLVFVIFLVATLFIMFNDREVWRR